MIRQWSAWLPDMAPWLPGCPVPTIEAALRRAAQDFFKQTRAWKVITDPVTVQAGAAEADVSTDDGQQMLVRIEAIESGGRYLRRVTPDEIPAAISAGPLTSFCELAHDAILLLPSPSAQCELRYRLSVAPSMASQGIPGDLFDKYSRQIEAGAAAFLKLQAGQSWSDVAAGAALEASFKSMIFAANHDAAKGFGRGRIPSNPTWC